MVSVTVEWKVMGRVNPNNKKIPSTSQTRLFDKVRIGRKELAWWSHVGLSKPSGDPGASDSKFLPCYALLGAREGCASSRAAVRFGFADFSVGILGAADRHRIRSRARNMQGGPKKTHTGLCIHWKDWNQAKICTIPGLNLRRQWTLKNARSIHAR